MSTTKMLHSNFFCSFQNLENLEKKNVHPAIFFSQNSSFHGSFFLFKLVRYKIFFTY